MRIRQTIHIHSIKTEYHIRQSHHDGQCGQHLHHDVQVVGNDRCKGVHRVGKDVCIDRTHLDCLLDLDDNIFQKLFILIIQLDDAAAQNLFQRDLVGFE